MTFSNLCWFSAQKELQNGEMSGAVLELAAKFRTLFLLILWQLTN